MAYITLGTGIGVGLIINGRTVHGYQHPEGGHLGVNLLPSKEKLKSGCLVHEFCTEGFCAAPYLSSALKTELNLL